MVNQLEMRNMYFKLTMSYHSVNEVFTFLFLIKNDYINRIK